MRKYAQHVLSFARRQTNYAKMLYPDEYFSCIWVQALLFFSFLFFSRLTQWSLSRDGWKRGVGSRDGEMTTTHLHKESGTRPEVGPTIRHLDCPTSIGIK